MRIIGSGFAKSTWTAALPDDSTWTRYATRRHWKWLDAGRGRDPTEFGCSLRGPFLPGKG